jgi:hypothetical protein
MRSGVTPSDDDTALQQLYRSLPTPDQAVSSGIGITNAILQQLSNLTNARYARIRAPRSQLPWLLWVVVIGGAIVVLLAVTAVTFVERSWAQFWVLGRLRSSWRPSCSSDRSAHRSPASGCTSTPGRCSPRSRPSRPGWPGPTAEPGCGPSSQRVGRRRHSPSLRQPSRPPTLPIRLPVVRTAGCGRRGGSIPGRRGPSCRQVNRCRLKS